MHRSTALAAAPALAAVLTVALSAPAQACHRPTFAGRLVDLQPATAGPLDGARAELTLGLHHGTTRARLSVTRIDRRAAGTAFATHLHVGPCVAGDGAAAGPHYNQDVVEGRTPARVNPRTEIWLDFTVRRGGKAHAATTVPFVPKPGRRSIVVHAVNSDGTAGTRLACLPVSW